MTLRGFLLTGALGVAIVFGGAAPAVAHDTCQDRIHREEHKLQRDINKHGWNSRQAQDRREKIFRLRRECGGNFWGFWGRDRDRDRRWDQDDRRWDQDDRRWDREDRRWDRNDRRWNRDRDRDDWFWDGRQWRRRDRDRNDWYWDGRQWRRH